MAATTVPIPTVMRRCSEPKEGETVAAADALYTGAMAGLDATGFAASPAAGVNAIGIVDTRGESGAAGTRVKIRYGDALMSVDAGETIDDTHVGDVAYAKNNSEISLNVGEGVPCGVITGVDGGKVWVNFDPARNTVPDAV
jgi:hypothetical protein